MGCFLLILSWISPRFVLALLWVFSDRLDVAFRSGLVGVAGFLFLPYTSVMWVLSYDRVLGVTGIGWILVGLGLLADLGSWGSGGRRGRRRRRA